ncbi:hypothetical protein NXY28_23690 [Bacteroides thetaiotaomicron]|nr:hypothetical protein NXY28_23690 [Bacteroides thetaiotaomicron]
MRKALLNGQEFTRNYLTHDELKQGGELNLSMDSVPNQQRVPNRQTSHILIPSSFNRF